jgi:hypothetical protein
MERATARATAAQNKRRACCKFYGNTSCCLASNTNQYVAISPYAHVGETFVFIKRQVAGGEAPFIVNFEQEPVHSNLAADSTDSSSSMSDNNDEAIPDPFKMTEEAEQESEPGSDDDNVRVA